MTHSQDGGRQERILVLAPQGRDARLAEAALVRSGLACRICPELAALRAELAAGAGAALIAEEALPPRSDGDPVAWLGSEPPWSQLPVVVLTMPSARSDRRLAALKVLETRPYVSFLQRPVPRLSLVSALRSALEGRRRQYVVRDLLDALAAGVRQRDDFLATLAHELRNLLSPIRTGTEVLARSVGEAASARSTLRIIERQVAHMARLIDDLLDVSRIAMGKIPMRMDEVDLRESIREATDVLSASARGGGRTLAISVPAEPLMLNADPVRIVQVLTNLVGNSLKFTSRGGRIQVVATREDRHAVLSVRDDGIGMAPEALARVFEMFEQAGPARAGGLGIGLTLTRALVELHGGSIEARSDGPGRGAEFVVRLPLAARARRKVEQRTPNSDGAILRGHRVLVVDDNLDVAASMVTLLQLLGADAEMAHEGHSALALLERFRPTDVLLDLAMPGMGGDEVARRMRRHELARGIRIIALSGGPLPPQADNASLFDGQLAKPVPVDELTKALSES